jgi:predicted adenylyl cyclase CyaB
MKNLELKVKVYDFRRVIRLLKSMGAADQGKFVQTDTYYYCRKGRLKVRETEGSDIELISYQRQDTENSKISDYQLMAIQPRQLVRLKMLLAISLGETIVVKKVRQVWLYKHTKIHLDQVKSLGKFIELETAMDVIGLKEARTEHSYVIGALKLARLRKVRFSYSDLMIQR